MTSSAVLLLHIEDILMILKLFFPFLLHNCSHFMWTTYGYEPI